MIPLRKKEIENKKHFFLAPPPFKATMPCIAEARLTASATSSISKETTEEIRQAILRALLEIRYDRFSRGFERDSKAGCGRQHNEAAWPELHARRNAIRLI